MHQLTPEQRFADLLAIAASRPFVTYYDEATGERSELSVKSCANWVAKTHFLLSDELGLGVGDTAAIALPAHWISVPILLGCLSAGLTLTDTGDAEVAFVSPERATQVSAADVYAIDPARAAVGFGAETPEGMEDYVAAVRPQGDAWAGVRMPAGPGDDAWPGVTRVEADERAQHRAGDLELGAGGRLLSTRDWRTPADWVDALLVPLAVSGSLVLVRNADDATVERRAQQERAGVVVR